MNSSIRWVAVAIDCADAGPVARFYERLLGFQIGDFDPPRWAQLWDPQGGMHLNIQGERWYARPVWPEQDGTLHKMLHFEVEVDDVDAAVARAIEAGGTEAPWHRRTAIPHASGSSSTPQAIHSVCSSTASDPRAPDRRLRRKAGWYAE